MPHDPEDVQRYEQFRAYVRDTQKALGLSSQDCADNFNATLLPGEKPAHEANLRTLYQRRITLSTITRQTCRKVARMLGVPVSEVLLHAGYLPDTLTVSDYELPLEYGTTFARLRPAYRERVYQAITDAWRDQLDKSGKDTNFGNLPEDARRQYTLLPEEAKHRVHRFIKFELSEATKRA